MPPGCTCVQPMLLFSLLFDLTNTIIQRLALFQSWSGSVFRQSHTWARCCSPSTPSFPWGWGWPTTDGESSVEDSNTASRPPLSSGIPDESVPAKTVSSTPVSQPNPATRPTTKLRRKEGCDVENQQMFLQFRLYKFAMCASARRGHSHQVPGCFSSQTHSCVPGCSMFHDPRKDPEMSSKKQTQEGATLVGIIRQIYRLCLFATRLHLCTANVVVFFNIWFNK